MIIFSNLLDNIKKNKEKFETLIINAAFSNFDILQFVF